MTYIFCVSLFLSRSLSPWICMSCSGMLWWVCMSRSRMLWWRCYDFCDTCKNASWLIHIYVSLFDTLLQSIGVFCRALLQKRPIFSRSFFSTCYGVATVSRLLKNIGLFCKNIGLFCRALLQKKHKILRSLRMVATLQNVEETHTHSYMYYWLPQLWRGNAL